MKEAIEGIAHEQVDDIPLLLAVMEQMGLIDILNDTLVQHGNWTGLGAGTIIGVWLAYILSTGDHRKNQLEDWVAERRRTLQQSLGVDEIRALDFTDDRLGIILHKLSDDAVWQESECAINQRIIKVYDLEVEIARLDTTTASSYGAVSEDGLLQFGYSKDHRPDLGQVKIASLTLDPLGMPLITIPVSGEQADDGLYLPSIEQARASLGGKTGVLYVGDSKMEAFETRHQLASQGDHYLMPLSKKQVKDETMRAYLDEFEARPDEERLMEAVLGVDETGQEVVLAEGFTVSVVQQGASHTWTERRFIVRSPEYAQKQQAHLEQRLTQTEAALQHLVQHRRGYQYPSSVADLEQRVADLLAAAGCAAYLEVAITAAVETKQIRPYKGRPAREEQQTTFQLHVSRHADALAQKQRVLGWRAYATNAPAEKLTLAKAVDVYRDAYLHEHGYSRLKGKPLSLTPMYLHNDDQMIGLIRLLSLALRVLTLIEFVVRQRLAAENSDLTGVYAGNRTRKTRTPRTETLLAVFKGLILTIIQTGEQEWVHVTPLTATQERILHLLGLTVDIYTALGPAFSNRGLKSAN